MKVTFKERLIVRLYLLALVFAPAKSLERELGKLGNAVVAEAVEK